MQRLKCAEFAIMQVADIADVVRQRADALMLSGESAAGEYPDKAVNVLRAVATRIEEWCRCPLSFISLPETSCWPGFFILLLPMQCQKPPTQKIDMPILQPSDGILAAM